eukprot:COSAG02_NODE_20109_length_848_cov_0.946595_2_plen_107_part_00
MILLRYLVLADALKENIVMKTMGLDSNPIGLDGARAVLRTLQTFAERNQEGQETSHVHPSSTAGGSAHRSENRARTAERTCGSETKKSLVDSCAEPPSQSRHAVGT